MTNGDPGSGLKTPCQSLLLDSAGWLFRVSFTPQAVGTSTIVLRAQPDFPLSFGDLCDSGPFVPGDGIDEALSATVKIVGPPLFADSFESSDTSAWTATVN